MLKFGLPPLIALCLLLLSTSGASAASASLTVDPASVTKNPNDTFTVTLKITNDFEMAGAQTNVIFNPLVVHIEDVAAATPWQTAQFIGLSPSKQAKIDDANSTGKLLGIATFYTAGAGSVPAGTSDFLVLTMKAVGGGTSAISFTPEPLYQIKTTDVDGNQVPLTTTAGSVTVTGPSASPTPTASPTPSPTPEGQTPTPTPSPSPSPTPTLAVQATMWVSPATLAVRPGAEFTIDIKQKTDDATSGTQFTFGFDANLFELETVTKGTAFSKANVVYGIAPVTGKAAITQANSTGILPGIAGFLTPPATVAAGEATFVTIKLKAKTTIGSSDIKLSSVEMLKADGSEVGVATTDGKVDVSNSAPVSLPTTGGAPGASDDTGWLVVLGGLLAVLAGGAAVSVARRRF